MTDSISGNESRAVRPDRMNGHRCRGWMIRMVAAWTLVVSGGCASHRTLPRLSRAFPATQPSDFYDQPAIAHAAGSDFDNLWSAAEQTARDFGFALDREDARSGLLTTQPLISKQFFEIWRRDVPDLSDQADASLATYRRTIHFQFMKTPTGWAVTPYVLIERLSWAETPISSTVYVQSAFGIRRGGGNIQPYGTHESDRGIRLPPRYWYPTGRDEALEKQLANCIVHHVKHS
jgi:hypothetical protein